MNLVNKKTALMAVVTVWILLWVNYIGRDLFKHGFLRQYVLLARASADRKRAITYGEKFYELLKFAKDNIPEGAHYGFAGTSREGSEPSLQERRGVYYLYPSLNVRYPKYILVYDVPGYTLDGYLKHAELDNGRFILKKF